METAEMRRSTLQRKDREELTLIATTLGKKPATRARKGEIIDLILDLAAGGDGSSVASEEPDAVASANGGAETAGAETADGDTSVGDTSVDDTGVDENWSDESGADESRSDEPGADGTESRSDETRSDTQEAGSADDEAPPGGGVREASAEQVGDGRDETGRDETGRKRRRRGRERENNRDSADQWDGEPIPVAGYLELRHEGYGFLRVDGALPSKDDAYVPVKMVRQYGLRKGDHLAGTSRPANRNEKNPAMVEIRSVNGGDPEAVVSRIDIESLPAVYPSQPIVFAGSQEPSDPTARVIDILTPFGRGQRALLAGAPRTGRTTILQHLIRSIETNHPDIELLVLLLDERPEDVTEMTRWVERGDVVAAAFDRPAEEQVTIAEMVIERAKRLVESGRDVVVVVDGITRLARAYAQEAAGNRGGVVVDATTVHPAKRFLAAARKLEGGGSLTMIATINIDTDSATDAAVYEELSPTANLEIRLSRAAAVRRLFPAIDIGASATVHEERLVDEADLAAVAALRRELASLAADPSTDECADLQALLHKIAAE